MTFSLALVLLKSWWREVLILLLALVLWGTWSCKGAAAERAARKLERERIARTAAEETAKSCDAALTVQSGAIEIHKKRMAADLAAKREVERAVAELHARHQLALQERDLRVEELRQTLAAIPKEDRCENAARWAAARYREVTRVPD